MSDLLEQAAADTLLVTHLANTHLARMAGLMDVPALCLAGGATPSAELLQAAAEAGTAVLVSPVGAAETLALVQACLDEGRPR
jgi:serine kinase of HPr protein (carbohydrate metabolism regulator)